MKLLGGINRSDFLNDYWQKQPLLITSAFPDFSPPISAHQLRSLADNENVESRLIHTANREQSWSIDYGPFPATRLQQLPETHWTLLIQSVDHHYSELAELLEKFDFIPSWRVDDIMISLASDGGSVGPHVDNYDVFLLQAQGQRQWSINSESYGDEDFIADLDFKVLKEFTAEQSWILSPGDMLYLPPNIAHHGVAIGDDCMTISVGFRAPEFQEMLMCYLDEWHIRNTSRLYSDPELELQAHPGEISSIQIDAIKKMLSDTLLDDEGFNHWFGQYITSAADAEEHLPQSIDYSEFEILFKQSAVLTRHGNVRINFIQHPDQIGLYINGEEYLLDNELAEFVHYLSARHVVDYQDIVSMKNYTQALNILWDFYGQGWFYNNWQDVS